MSLFRRPAARSHHVPSSSCQSAARRSPVLTLTTCRSARTSIRSRLALASVASKFALSITTCSASMSKHGSRYAGSAAMSSTTVRSATFSSLGPTSRARSIRRHRSVTLTTRSSRAGISRSAVVDRFIECARATRADSQMHLPSLRVLGVCPGHPGTIYTRPRGQLSDGWGSTPR